MWIDLKDLCSRSGGAYDDHGTAVLRSKYRGYTAYAIVRRNGVVIPCVNVTDDDAPPCLAVSENDSPWYPGERHNSGLVPWALNHRRNIAAKLGAPLSVMPLQKMVEVWHAYSREWYRLSDTTIDYRQSAPAVKPEIAQDDIAILSIGPDDPRHPDYCAECQQWKRDLGMPLAVCPACASKNGLRVTVVGEPAPVQEPAWYERADPFTIPAPGPVVEPEPVSLYGKPEWSSVLDAHVGKPIYVEVALHNGIHVHINGYLGYSTAESYYYTDGITFTIEHVARADTRTGTLCIFLTN